MRSSFIIQFHFGCWRGIALFPDRLAGCPVKRDDEFLLAFAVHRVKPVCVHDDGRMTLAQSAAPQSLRATGRPCLTQPFCLDHKVTLRSAPLRPALGSRGNAQNQPTKTKSAEF